jgi:hypothetical protein
MALFRKKAPRPSQGAGESPDDPFWPVPDPASAPARQPVLAIRGLPPAEPEPVVPFVPRVSEQSDQTGALDTDALLAVIEGMGLAARAPAGGRSTDAGTRSVVIVPYKAALEVSLALTPLKAPETRLDGVHMRCQVNAAPCGPDVLQSIVDTFNAKWRYAKALVLPNRSVCVVLDAVLSEAAQEALVRHYVMAYLSALSDFLAALVAAVPPQPQVQVSSGQEGPATS